MIKINFQKGLWIRNVALLSDSLYCLKVPEEGILLNRSDIKMVYPSAEVSSSISTTWWGSLLVDHKYPLEHVAEVDFSWIVEI